MTTGDDKTSRGTSGSDLGSDETQPALEIMDTAASDETLPASVGAPVAELPEIERDVYEFGAELARGGMGRILYARDRRLDRPVAVKELLYDEPALAARFEREALLTSKLQHPSIVPVYEAGRWPSGEPFYTMKKVDGRPLSRLIDEAETTADRIALLSDLISVAEAVAYAHSKQVIHRDLKPANVLVGSFGETVVIDWGLAKDLGAAETEPDELGPTAGDRRADDRARRDSAGLTAHGAVLGTPAYMPPEQARGEAVDQRADVYAIGAMLYHALSGQPAFTGKSSRDVLARVIAEHPEPLSALAPETPGDLVSIVEKAMAREPEDRYDDAAALAEELRRFRDGRRVGAHAYTTWSLIRRWAIRHRNAVSIAAIAVVVLAVAIGVAIRRVRAEADQARRSLAELLEEQGRLELIDRRPLRALTYLREAVRQSAAIDPALATMLRRAARPARAIDAMLERHSDAITTIAVSADGSTAWTGGRDNLVHVWDLASASHRRTIELDAPLRSIALAAGDRRLVVITDDSVTLRDSATGEQVAEIETSVMGDDAPRAAVSADGSRFLTVGHRSLVTVRDSMTGRPVGRLMGHSERVNDAAFSADDTAIITAGADGAAKIWDAATYRERTTLAHDASWDPKQPHQVIAARLRPDGARAITATTYGIAVVWDVATATELRRFQVPGIREVAYAPDPKQILTRSTEVEVWTEDSERAVAHLANPDSWITAMALSGDGSRLVAVGLEGSQLVWNTADWSLAGSLDHGRQALRAAAFLPDGRVIAGGDAWSAVIWRPAPGDVLQTFGLPDSGPLRATQLAPARDRLLSASGAGVAVWSIGGDRAPSSIELEALGATFDASGRRVAVLARGAQGYSVRDLESGAELFTLARPPAEEPPEPRRPGFLRGVGQLPVAFSPDGQLVAAILPGGGAHVWSAETGEHRLAATRGPLRNGDVRFSPDGSALAIADARQLSLYSAADLERRWSSEPSEASLGVIRFSPDGRVLMIADDRGGVDLRDRAGERLRYIEGAHRALIIDASIAELDGALHVLLASADHGASVWSVETGALRFRLEGHTGPVTTIDVDPRGERIATSSTDGTARLWDAATGRQIAALRGTVDTTSQIAAFTAAGSGLVTSVGDAAVLWDVAAEAPSRGDILGPETFWRLDDGHLVRARDARD